MILGYAPRANDTNACRRTGEHLAGVLAIGGFLPGPHYHYALVHEHLLLHQ